MYSFLSSFQNKTGKCTAIWKMSISYLQKKAAFQKKQPLFHIFPHTLPDFPKIHSPKVHEVDKNTHLNLDFLSSPNLVARGRFPSRGPGGSSLRTPLISLSPHGSSAWVAGTAVRPEDPGGRLVGLERFETNI